MPTVRDHYGLRRPALKDAEVGIEIEVEGRGVMFPNPPGWRIEHDGSLRGEACEYVLSRPIARNNVPAALKTLSAAIAENKATLSDSKRCGVHVHLNCQDLELKQVMVFITLYVALEEALIKFCDPSREDNLFCLRAKDAMGLIVALEDAQKRGDFQLINDRYRYAAINVTALGKYGSLEFRALDTPASFKKIEKWVEILLKIKDKSLQFEEPMHIMEAVSGMGGERFFAFILEETARYIPPIPDLEDIVMEGVRLIQGVAYIPWGDSRKTFRNTTTLPRGAVNFAEMLRGPEAAIRPQWQVVDNRAARVGAINMMAHGPEQEEEEDDDRFL